MDSWPSSGLRLTAAEAEVLEARSRSPLARAAEARRARLILLLAAGYPYRRIQRELGCSGHTVARWKARFVEERLAGLYARHEGRRPAPESRRIEARVAAAAPREERPFSLRRLARELGVHPMTVARAWSRAGAGAAVRSHREPPFARGIGELLALYLKPPQHAAVFGMEEQAVAADCERDDVVLQSLGQPPLAQRDYLSATAGLELALRREAPPGRDGARHSSAELAAFLEQAAVLHSSRRLELLADNPSTWRGASMRRFFVEHADVRCSLSASHGDWSASLERRIAALERVAVAEGVVTAGFKDRVLARLRAAAGPGGRPMKWMFRPSPPPSPAD